MKRTNSRTRELLLWRTGASALFFASTALAQTAPVRPFVESTPTNAAPAPSFDFRALCALPTDALIYDAPGDGSLWARGTDYKARFDAQGALVVPFFGSDAPKNHPIGFRVASAQRGALALAATPGVVERDGDVVRIDRGAFVEEYELGAHALEQRFVFPKAAGNGELALRLAIDTDLERKSAGKGFRFENELGRVDYGQAVAIDAAGRRIAMESVAVEGGVELRVPAAFADAASFPLVVDPLITFFTASHSSLDEVAPDVSYDASTDRWCITWTSIWSASDYDQFARLLDGNGTSFALMTIDFTTDVWATPAIANNNGSNSFLVCAAVVPISGVADVRGRFVGAADASVGNVLQISPLDGAYRNGPDVGGDTYLGTFSNYCVVWQRSVSANRVDIESRVVSPTGVLGPIHTLSTLPTVNLFPSISDTMGEVAGDGMEAWNVVWQARHNLQDNDIYAVQLNWDGSVRSFDFAVEVSFFDESRPAVSTLLDSSGFGDDRPYLVVFERDFGSDYDVVGAVCMGPGVLATQDFAGDVPQEYQLRNQIHPAVACDGERFLVANEEYTTGSSNTDLYTTGYAWTGSALVPCEPHASLAGSPAPEIDVALHSSASSGGTYGRFFATWSYQSANNGYDVQGALWEGCNGVEPRSFCFGDGTGAACPCGNVGANGHGCANSVSSGAVLTAAGSASVSNDSLVLHVEGSVPGKPGLFFRGDNATNGGVGLPFGDGLRCTGGNVRRIQVRTADAGGAASSTLGIAQATGLSFGAIERYQWWYRDPSSSPCGANFNLSNGLEVHWLQ